MTPAGGCQDTLVHEYQERDHAFAPDEILRHDEPDVDAHAWSLSELDRSCDLESVTSAWSRADERRA
jgi:hypothetical protein